MKMAIEYLTLTKISFLINNVVLLEASYLQNKTQNDKIKLRTVCTHRNGHKRDECGQPQI